MLGDSGKVFLQVSGPSKEEWLVEWGQELLRHSHTSAVESDSISLSPSAADLLFVPRGQSDVREVLVDMRTRFERSAGFEHCEEAEIERMALESGALVGEKGAVRVMDDEGFVAINPTAVPTEREVHSSADGERVYRSLFRKLAAQP